jgi:hypothetical protein
MKLTKFFIIAFCLNSFFAISQTREQQMMYKTAFDEMLQMIKGEKKYSFKRAVFLAENAWYGGTLSYKEYCDSIDKICTALRLEIQKRNIGHYKTAGNWAAFHYMFEPSKLNNFKIYSYDYDDFLSRKNWNSHFVTKLMKTKKGNCVSLPYFFKILSEELGYPAYLAQAPMHFYIMHKDENDKWVNIETTGGGFARDAHYLETFKVLPQQIRSGIYMTPRTNAESISLCINDLLHNYKKQFKRDILLLSMVEKTLAYTPNNFYLLLLKYHCYFDMAEREFKTNKSNKELIKQYELQYKNTQKKLQSIGYDNVSDEWYADMMKYIPANRKKKEEYFYKRFGMQLE